MGQSDTVEICRLCHDYNALFIINDRPDLAVLANADGVHLGQDDLPVAMARKILKPGMLIGQSTHTLEEATTALQHDIDYIAVGSVFGSLTKPEVAKSGLDLVNQIKDISPKPIVAIGGITCENCESAIIAGAQAVAICRAVTDSDNPDEVSRQLKQKLSSAV